VLDEHLDVGSLDLAGLAGTTQVTLAIRRMLKELAEPGQVPPSRGNVAVRLDAIGA
jgi:hypothetical protein